ncbi:conjugal transfer protein TraF [Elizabethkingia anophelis]|nr:conjugal transfer protein TraF [Elizabethkingia anophelis]
MNEYKINRGIGRTVEFKGLKAQYLFIFAGGLLGTLILVMILYMAGVNSYACLFLGIGGASLIVWQTFALNKRYGEHGLMKIGARKKYPRYIICRKPIHRYIKINTKSTVQ